MAGTGLVRMRRDARGAKNTSHTHRRVYSTVRPAVASMTMYAHNGPWRNPPSRSNSLLQNPFTGGMPASASRAEDEHRAGERHRPGKPAHLLHVACPDGVDDGARAEKQQRLEHGVAEEVELALENPARPDRIDHESELADGGPRQHALQVVRYQGHDPGNERGHHSHDDDGESSSPGRR